MWLFIIVVEMKCSKSTTSYMKIRLDIVRKKRIAMVNFLEMDIVDFLKNGLEYNAYTRVRLLSLTTVYGPNPVNPSKEFNRNLPQNISA